ncbi:MAG: hypothetical protein U1F70_06310 [Candidatus Competibacteraceae bacterium]
MNTTDWDPNYKHPGKTTVRLTLFWVSNYYQDTSQKVLKKAEQMLAEHGLGLDIYPKSRQSAPNHTIQIPGDPTQLLVNDPENTPYTYNWLRNQAAAIFDDQATKDKRQRLPVFFCQFKASGYGITVLNSNWLPYCLIGANPDPDGYCLIHEIIHAATNSAIHCNTPKCNVFGDIPGNIMIRTHVQAIAKAYFSR